jgi:hypothetical protein
MLERVAAIDPAFADDRTGVGHLRLGEVAGLIYPTLDRDRLLTVTMKYAWCCLYDDLCDLDQQPDRAQLHALQRRIVDVLGGDGARADDTPLIRLVAAFDDALGPLLAGRDRSGLVHALWQWLASNAWEVDQRSHGVPPLPLYLGMRGYTIGAYMGLELDLLLLGIELEPRVRHHPLIEQLDRLTANYVGWTNDIYSAARSSGVELVTVLRHDLGFSYDEALSRVAQMCRADAMAYEELKPRLGSLGIEVDDHLRRYLEHQEHMMAGFAQWCQSTARYHGG